MRNIKLKKVDIEQNTYMYDKYQRLYQMEDGWHSGNKLRNFKEMAAIAEFTGVPLSGTSCLDVGCGSGDLSLFLRKRGVKEYLGIDIYEKAIQKAREKYPRETFILDDFLAVSLRKKFHYVFCSGSLTVKLPTMDNYTFLEAAVAKMWKLAKVGVVFNVLTDEEPEQERELFFYDPSKVENVCKHIIGDNQLIIENTPNVAQIQVYLYRNDIQQIA